MFLTCRSATGTHPLDPPRGVAKAQGPGPPTGTAAAAGGACLRYAYRCTKTGSDDVDGGLRTSGAWNSALAPLLHRAGSSLAPFKAHIDDGRPELVTTTKPTGYRTSTEPPHRARCDSGLSSTIRLCQILSEGFNSHIHCTDLTGRAPALWGFQGCIVGALGIRTQYKLAYLKMLGRDF